MLNMKRKAKKVVVLSALLIILLTTLSIFILHKNRLIESKIEKINQQYDKDIKKVALYYELENPSKIFYKDETDFGSMPKELEDGR